MSQLPSHCVNIATHPMTSFRQQYQFNAHFLIFFNFYKINDFIIRSSYSSRTQALLLTKFTKIPSLRIWRQYKHRQNVRYKNGYTLGSQLWKDVQIKTDERSRKAMALHIFHLLRVVNCLKHSRHFSPRVQASQVGGGHFSKCLVCVLHLHGWLR